MLAGGVFITPTARFTFYEVKESGYYRIDFMDFNANFQVDFQKTRFSLVRKRRNTFVYGASVIYDTYLKVRGQIESAQLKSDKKSEWFNGDFVTRIHSYNDKLGYTIDSILTNNMLTETTLSGMNHQIVWVVQDPLYGVKADPINFNQYEHTSLSKDTVNETTTAGVFYSIDVLKRRYDLSHIDKLDIVVATDLKTARERLKLFKEDPYPFRGFDTETTGLDICLYGDDKMVGIILGNNPTSSTYFPFRHKGDFNLPMDFLPELMEAIMEKQGCLVAHNKKFDREVMLFEGYDLHIEWDTLQIAIILNPVIGKGTHALKTLIFELNGKKFLELDDIFINPKDIDFSVLDPELIKYYACPDGTNVLELLADQLLKLPKYQYRLAKLECDLADVKADMEFYGIRVDVKRYERAYRNCNYVLELLLESFRKLTHEDGNINSKQVLNNLLYNKMHCKVLRKMRRAARVKMQTARPKLRTVRPKGQTARRPRSIRKRWLSALTVCGRRRG